MYDFDVSKYIRQKIFKPTIKPVFEAFLNALLTGVKTLLSQFQIYRNTKLDELKINGHKRILQYWLNKKFDPVEERIQILNYDAGTKIFVYLASENKPLYLPKYLGGSDYDFIVRLHFTSFPIQDKIVAFVNTYKLPTKRYQINYYV